MYFREFVSKHLDVTSGIRDLDAVIDPSAGHTSAHPTGIFSLPWAEQRKSDKAPDRQTVSSAQASGSMANPRHWAVIGSNRPIQKRRISDADTVIISPISSNLDVSSESSLTSASIVPTVGVSSANSRVVVLEDDSDDEINESHSAHESLAGRSAHSSNRYYDASHEAACRAYIKQEDEMRVTNVSVEI